MGRRPRNLSDIAARLLREILTTGKAKLENGKVIEPSDATMVSVIFRLAQKESVEMPMLKGFHFEETAEAAEAEDTEDAEASLNEYDGSDDQ